MNIYTFEDAKNYDYRNAIIEDLRDIYDEYVEKEMDKDEAFEALYDGAFVSDSVTGNASGSYTFNRWTAEKNVGTHLDLAAEAFEEFCEPEKLGEYILDGNFEAIDVTIRCYLLGECVGTVIDEHYED